MMSNYTTTHPTFSKFMSGECRAVLGCDRVLCRDCWNQYPESPELLIHSYTFDECDECGGHVN